jgi:hypothetical protein
MSARVAVVGTRSVLVLIALGCGLCLLATFAAAQNNQPKDEIFGGYSWLAPNGYGDLDFKVNNIVAGFDASNTYYLPRAHNLGFLLDGSGHFNGGMTPNPGTDGNTGTSVGFGLGGLQYKYHASPVSPFVRILIGAANISPDCCGGTRWSFAGGGGGGLDFSVGSRISIRMVQFDYIYSNYNHSLPSSHPTDWNNIRLAAGLVLNLGSYYAPPVTASCTATPASVLAGEPVTVTAAGANFNPKHTLTYAWTLNGGKLDNPSLATTKVDTTGMSDGTYTANATITDPKGPKNHNVANCGANFNVNVPHNPPQVTCRANPNTVKSGETSTITASATSPDKAEITGYRFSAPSGTLTPSGNTATLDTTGLSGQTVPVTVTATDSRGLTGNCTAEVGVIAEVKCVSIEDWGECTFEKNPKKPWRVDNDCKDTLDKLALRLQQMPNGKLDIVGYTDEKEVVSEQTLGAQRSVNVKYYLTTDGPTKVDASRIQPRAGGTKGKATHFYFVPEGNLCSGQLEEGTVVDESQVQPQSRTAPAPKKKAKKPAAPPAQ